MLGYCGFSNFQYPISHPKADPIKLCIHLDFMILLYLSPRERHRKMVKLLIKVLRSQEKDTIFLNNLACFLSIFMFPIRIYMSDLNHVNAWI
jgi:hypothetical protein